MEQSLGLFLKEAGVMDSVRERWESIDPAVKRQAGRWGAGLGAGALGYYLANKSMGDRDKIAPILVALAAGVGGGLGAEAIMRNRAGEPAGEVVEPWGLSALPDWAKRVGSAGIAGGAGYGAFRGSRAAQKGYRRPLARWLKANLGDKTPITGNWITKPLKYMPRATRNAVEAWASKPKGAKAKAMSAAVALAAALGAGYTADKVLFEAPRRELYD